MHCLDELQRARELQSLPQRFRRILPLPAAALVILTLLVVTADGIQQHLGSAASNASVACAAVGLGMSHPALVDGTQGSSVTIGTVSATLPERLEATPAAAPPTPMHSGTIAIVRSVIEPGHLTLEVRGESFQPDELVCLVGGLSGEGRDGRPRRDSVGPLGAQVDRGGTVIASMDFGTWPGGYVGPYMVDLAAFGVAELRGHAPPARLRAIVKGTALYVLSGA